MAYLQGTNNSGGWGYNSPHQVSANKIDHIADKMNFALDIISNQILSIDGIENELRALATGTAPPRPEQLIALAARLDSCQNQITDNVSKVKLMTKEIETTTDTIQTSKTW